MNLLGIICKSLHWKIFDIHTLLNLIAQNHSDDSKQLNAEKLA